MSHSRIVFMDTNTYNDHTKEVPSVRWHLWILVPSAVLLMTIAFFMGSQSKTETNTTWEDIVVEQNIDMRETLP